jgi:molybdopterin molybdotransferase
MTKESNKQEETKRLVSLNRAKSLIGKPVCCGLEPVELAKAGGRVCAEDIVARSDCPSLDSSLRDGFAVQARDVQSASSEYPGRLELVGTVVAGQQNPAILKSGQAIRIMTGAPMPAGADAVLASEFARQEGDMVFACGVVRQGGNILFKGKDVRGGERIVKSGTVLSPAHLGLLAAGGVSEVVVCRRPKIMVVAIGSELVAPGEVVTPGKVAASNLVAIVEELKNCGIPADQMIISDDLDRLHEAMEPLAGRYDLVLTCGGVLDGDKDFTMQVMGQIGVEAVFNRVRVCPGKGTCFGRKDGTLFFNLPGGPPSNYVSFLLLVMPTVLQLSGISDQPAVVLHGRLTKILSGKKGWTQIHYGRLQSDPNGHGLTVTPVQHHRRLYAMAEADCLLMISEHYDELKPGTVQKVWKFK